MRAALETTSLTHEDISQCTTALLLRSVSTLFLSHWLDVVLIRVRPVVSDDRLKANGVADGLRGCGSTFAFSFDKSLDVRFGVGTLRRESDTHLMRWFSCLSYCRCCWLSWQLTALRPPVASALVAAVARKSHRLALFLSAQFQFQFKMLCWHELELGAV